jgi:hypothetical protein
VAPTPPAPQRPQQQDFDPTSILRDLSRQARVQPPAQPSPQQAATAARRTPNAPFDPARPLSSAEEGSIRGHVEGKWNKDRGAKGIESFVVEIKVRVGQGGAVQGEPEIVSQSGSPAEPLRAFVESARRAVLRSSPLPVPERLTERGVYEITMVFRGVD